MGRGSRRKTRRDLLLRIEAISVGKGLGHRGADLDFRQPTLCATVPPHVTIYNPQNRIVLRIADCRRDFHSVAADERKAP